MQNTETAAAFLAKRPLKRIPGDDIAEVENEEHTQFPATFCADKAAAAENLSPFFFLLLYFAFLFFFASLRSPCVFFISHLQWPNAFFVFWRRRGNKIKGQRRAVIMPKERNTEASATGGIWRERERAGNNDKENKKVAELDWGELRGEVLTSCFFEAIHLWRVEPV
jgi:hypothetical protein